MIIYVTEVADTKKLIDEIVKFSPSEIICNDNLFTSAVMDIDDLRERLGISINILWMHGILMKTAAQKLLCKHFKVTSTDSGSVLDDFTGRTDRCRCCACSIYTKRRKTVCPILHTLLHIIASKYMLLDSSTRRNLELTETLREKQKRGSLLWVLDKTKTAMGAQTAPYSIWNSR